MIISVEKVDNGFIVKRGYALTEVYSDLIKVIDAIIYDLSDCIFDRELNKQKLSKLHSKEPCNTEPSSWISINNKLPRPSKRVLLLVNRGVSLAGGFICVGYLIGDEFWTSIRTKKVNNSQALENVTHWMPLPELPKEEV